jgi:hypothetical protein
MKDFKEAAENLFEQLEKSGFDLEYFLPIDLATEAVKHGYSEAMKEHREFCLKVTSYMTELELYLSKTGEADYILLESLHTDVLKHLSSFTEQSNKEDNGER